MHSSFVQVTRIDGTDNTIIIVAWILWLLIKMLTFWFVSESDNVYLIIIAQIGHQMFAFEKASRIVFTSEKASRIVFTGEKASRIVLTSEKAIRIGFTSEHGCR